MQQFLQANVEGHTFGLDIGTGAVVPLDRGGGAALTTGTGRSTATEVSKVSEVYVLGSWKSGDTSQEEYVRLPMGMLDRVLPPGTVPLLKVPTQCMHTLS
jgi:hypothetical protein